MKQTNFLSSTSDKQQSFRVIIQHLAWDRWKERWTTFAAALTTALLIVPLVKSNRRPSSSNSIWGDSGACTGIENHLQSSFSTISLSYPHKHYTNCIIFFRLKLTLTWNHWRNISHLHTWTLSEREVTSIENNLLWKHFPPHACSNRRLWELELNEKLQSPS